METLTVNDLRRLCSERNLNPGKLRKQQILELLRNDGLVDLPSDVVVRDTPRKSILTPSRSRQSTAAAAAAAVAAAAGGDDAGADKTETPRAARRRTKAAETPKVIEDKENETESVTPRGRRRTRGPKRDAEEHAQREAVAEHTEQNAQDANDVSPSSAETDTPSEIAPGGTDTAATVAAAAAAATPSSPPAATAVAAAAASSSPPVVNNAVGVEGVVDSAAAKVVDGDGDTAAGDAGEPSAKRRSSRRSGSNKRGRDDGADGADDVKQGAPPAKKANNDSSSNDVNDEAAQTVKPAVVTFEDAAAPATASQPAASPSPLVEGEGTATLCVGSGTVSELVGGQTDRKAAMNDDDTPSSDAATSQTSELPLDMAETGADSSTSPSIVPSGSVFSAPTAEQTESPGAELSNGSSNVDGVSTPMKGHRKTWSLGFNPKTAFHFASDQEPSPGGSRQSSPEPDDEVEMTTSPNEGTNRLTRDGTFVVATPSSAIKRQPRDDSEAPRTPFTASKVPNFKKLHEKEQARMESIVDHSSRKRERMRQLLKTTREIRDAGSKARKSEAAPKTPIAALKHAASTPSSSAKKILSDKVRSNRRFDLLMKARGITVDDHLLDDEA